MRVKGIALGAGLAALLLVLALSPALASARPHRVKTKLHFQTFGIINPDGSHDWLYFGSISPFLAPFPCVLGRKVQFYRGVPNAPDELIGTRRTNIFSGIALLVQPDADLTNIAGNYYANMHKVKKKTRKGRVICTGDRSRTITVVTPQLHPVSNGSAKGLRAGARALSP